MNLWENPGNSHSNHPGFRQWPDNYVVCALYDVYIHTHTRQKSNAPTPHPNPCWAGGAQGGWVRAEGCGLFGLPGVYICMYVCLRVYVCLPCFAVDIGRRNLRFLHFLMFTLVHCRHETTTSICLLCLCCLACPYRESLRL